MLVFILSISMILANMTPAFAAEAEDKYATTDSIEETAVLSNEDKAHLDWVDITYPDVRNDFSVICDSEKDYDHVFARMGDEPHEDVALVSFTNGYQEHFRVTAVSNNAKKIRVYNEGPITVSNDDPEHSIGIQGYNGHGEEFYINRNMFDITDEEFENLTLGEEQVSGNTHYYEPIEGLGIRIDGFNKIDIDTMEEIRLTLNVLYLHC